jgi:hypothetical protein
MYITVTNYLKLHATLLKLHVILTENIFIFAKITCKFNRKNIFFNAKLILKYECLLIRNFYFKTKFMIDFSKYVYIRTKFC